MDRRQLRETAMFRIRRLENKISRKEIENV
jgi:hypothetical protein